MCIRDRITGAPINQNQLTQGTYIISLTDDNGCSSFPTNFTVQIFEPAQLSVSFTTTPVTCYGGIDGEISLTVNGGTGPYFYNWTPPSGAPAIPSTPIVSGLTSNIYFVEVSDVNGCSTDPNITTINVPGPQNNLAININVIDALCFGNTDGQAQAFPTGGTPPYSYEWSDGQTSQIATSLSSGSYTCIVTDANGCINSALAVVGEPNAINANLSTIDVSCFGLNDGSAVVNPTGGSGTGFSVLWNINIPNTFPPVPYTSLSVPNISPGVYTVTITDFSLPGCDVVEDVIITQPDILQITPNVEQIVSCFQGSDGSLSVNTIGGTTPYSFNWSSVSNNSVATTRIASNLSSQMYYVEVIDSNGCSITDSIFLGSNSQLIPNLSFDNVSCYGGSDGIAYSNPTGGTGPYSYNWSFTGSTNSSSSGLSANTTYSVQITDFNSCPTVTSFFTVPQPDSITVFSTIDSVTCYGLPDGSINVDSIVGGNPPFSLIWSDSTGTIGQIDTLASNLIAGTYHLSVTDDLGCVDTLNSYIVFEPEELIADIIISSNFNGSGITCINDSTGELTASATGGTGSYSYLWSTGDTTEDVSGLLTGPISCTITDCNGCVFVWNGFIYISVVNGCTDPLAFNFNPIANTDDGSCVYAGCLDPNALNYDALATVDDSSCVYPPALALQGIIDFTVPSGGSDGKAIHLIATDSIADLSIYGIGVANNGGGTDGLEYVFPAMSVNSGEDILLCRDSSVMASYFDVCFSEFDYVITGSGSISQNGDDAIELFMDSLVVETFGDINVDGSGECWEYLDSWAYKSLFGDSSCLNGQWIFGGVNCTDGSTTIYDASCLYPICLLYTSPSPRDRG